MLNFVTHKSFTNTKVCAAKLQGGLVTQYSFFSFLSGDAKRQVVRQVNTHNRVSLMHVDLCSMFNRYGDKERQALSSFDFLEKVLSQDLDGEQPYLDEVNEVFILLW